MATRTHPSRRARRPAAQASPSDVGPRPIWSGTITFGLVAVPVNLFPAVRPADTAMRMLAPDGAPVQRRYVCPKEDKDVPWDELVRGYQVGADEYLVLTDEELEAVAPRKSRDIDLRRFVPLASLDPFMFERAWVLTPGGESVKAYRLLAGVMEDEGKAGIATFVMRTKEYLVAILARRGILWAETLRFADELRTASDVGLSRAARAEATAVAALVRTIGSLAEEAVGRERLVEHRAVRLRALAEKKLAAGKGVVTAPAADSASPSQEADGAPDLFESIRRSLRLVGSRRGAGARRVTASGRRSARARSTTASARRTRSTGRRPKPASPAR